MKAVDRHRIVKLARLQGWGVRRGRGGHGVILLPPGGRPIPLRTHSSSDWRGERNLYATLRRAGLRGTEAVR